MENTQSAFLSDPKVAKRYDVHPRTLYRWDDDPEVEFPKPHYIGRRKYRSVAELEQWERKRAAGKRRRDDEVTQPAETAG
jgi:predicted DNA-binding transcriptional regulator AlpA